MTAEHHDDGVIRKFATGGTRDTSQGKIDPEGFFSPLVVEAFSKYMTIHQKQTDGSIRASDNWQKLFGTPEEHRMVCMKSLWRHFLDLWLIHRGYKGRMENGHRVTIDDALNGCMFNIMAYYFSLLKERDEEEKAAEKK